MRPKEIRRSTYPINHVMDMLCDHVSVDRVIDAVEDAPEVLVPSEQLLSLIARRVLHLALPRFNPFVLASVN